MTRPAARLGERRPGRLAKYCSRRGVVKTLAGPIRGRVALATIHGTAAIRRSIGSTAESLPGRSNNATAIRGAPSRKSGSWSRAFHGCHFSARQKRRKEARTAAA
jgi:hypothetical protein